MSNMVRIHFSCDIDMVVQNFRIKLQLKDTHREGWCTEQTLKQELYTQALNIKTKKSHFQKCD